MVKLAYQYDIDSVSLLLFRMLFALPFYVGVWLYHKKEWNARSLSKKERLGILGIGITGYYLSSFFDFKGLSYITASLERLILYTYPTMVLILSAVFLRKKISLKMILSILFTYAGMIIIFTDEGGILTGNNEELLLGSIFVGLSAFFYASYMVISYAVVSGIGSIRLTTYSMIISCILVFIHYFITTNSNLLGYQAEVYLYSIGMAVFATVIPSFMINEGIKRLGAPNVSIIGTIGPVSTITLSILLLGEMLTLTQFGGGLIIIGGVAFLTWNRRKK